MGGRDAPQDIAHKAGAVHIVGPGRLVDEEIVLVLRMPRVFEDAECLAGDLQAKRSGVIHRDPYPQAQRSTP